jgi:hypothetical protein
VKVGCERSVDCLAETEGQVRAGRADARWLKNGSYQDRSEPTGRNWATCHRQPRRRRKIFISIYPLIKLDVAV